jgi:hypothetical protein
MPPKDGVVTDICDNWRSCATVDTLDSNMKKEMTQNSATMMAKGFLAITREAFGQKNGAEFLATPQRLWLLILCCTAIGLVRNTIAVWLGETTVLGKWYSFDLDVMLAMALWPNYLLFFGSFSIHLILKILGEKKVSYRKVFSYFFYLQLLHLVIPFPDLINFKYGIPITFHFTEGQIVNDYYTNGLSMSIGIVLVWLVTGYMTLKLFRKYQRVKVLSLLVAAIVTFGMIVVKGYLVWPTYNTIFNQLFGIEKPFPPVFWGYSAYFFSMIIVGVAYYLYNEKIEQTHSGDG